MSGDPERCVSCGGRGWKIVSPARLVMAAEAPLVLSRRPCLDCGGSAGVGEPGLLPRWWRGAA